MYVQSIFPDTQQNTVWFYNCKQPSITGDVSLTHLHTLIVPSRQLEMRSHWLTWAEAKDNTQSRWHPAVSIAAAAKHVLSATLLPGRRTQTSCNLIPKYLSFSLSPQMPLSFVTSLFSRRIIYGALNKQVKQSIDRIHLIKQSVSIWRSNTSLQSLYEYNMLQCCFYFTKAEILILFFLMLH